MAFSASSISAEPRSWSEGPLKKQLLTYSVASGDTSGTITADKLGNLFFIEVTGPAGVFTAAPTYSGNVATIAFVNPAATRYGSIVAYGR